MDLEQRTGARTMAGVPPAVLVALNEGRTATKNLVEWLAIDQTMLLRTTLRDVKLRLDPAAQRQAESELATLTAMRRIETVGQLLHGALKSHRSRATITERLANHRSDLVRSWACYMIWADESLPLTKRLTATRPYAADPHFGVREAAWSSVRPFLAADLERGLKLLKPWVRDEDANVRRFAVELTRPRGVWCAHLNELRDRPERAISLLDLVRSDDSRYVQISVGNWLNDAAKDQPVWVRSVAKRWRAESPTPETDWIVKHGLRTIEPKTRKRG